MYEQDISRAFVRLARFAPPSRKTKDLARSVVLFTNTKNPYQVLKKLGCSVRSGPCGGDWLIIPMNNKEKYRWRVVIDQTRVEDLDVAYCECIAAILFDHFGRISPIVPEDIKQYRIDVSKKFTKALMKEFS